MYINYKIYIKPTEKNIWLEMKKKNHHYITS